MHYAHASKRHQYSLVYPANDPTNKPRMIKGTGLGWQEKQSHNKVKEMRN